MAQIHKSVTLTDRSSIGEVRRLSISAAQSLGFSEDIRSNIGIVATELATNALLHGSAGEVLICPSGKNRNVWLDLLALDKGGGISDIARALEDGFSTIGTAGHGFGAIQRLSSETSVYSIAERGTVVWTRFVNGSPPHGPALGVISVPIQSETVSGDAYLALEGQARSLYIVVDGLGHGRGAEEASKEAVTVAERHSSESPGELLARTHDALKKTRGAAMSIVIIDHDRQLVTYGGIGNITTVLITGMTSRNLVSQNGTLGAAVPRIQELVYPYNPGSSLLMFSDGLTSRCNLSAYPGLQNRHPQLIAGLLYRDFSRGRDDATVLFARIGSDWK